MMMVRVGFVVVFIGFLVSIRAAPERVKRQGTSSGTLASQSCQQIFNVPCDTLDGQNSNLPPLKTDITPEEEPDCECVIYYLCSANSTIVTDGSFLIDKRLGATCDRSLDVCCKKASIIQEPTVTKKPETPDVTPTPTPQPTPSPVKPGCGHRNPGGVVVRISGTDNEAQFAEFPWMVAVLQKPTATAPRSVYTCGGSLIHNRVVLTAAHTVQGKNIADLVVRAGEWDTQSRTEPIAHQEREVESIIIHEKFNTDNLQNDFALLILKTPFDTAPNVNTLCLPNAGDVFDATRCTATGWGKDNFEKTGRFQAVLKKIDLPVVPHEPCQTALRLTRLGNAFILNKSFTCAGGEAGQDTCTGDGGSPLACPLASDPTRYVQAGIVAWGIGCGADRTPGVYANVAQARSWIDDKLRQRQLDTSSYVV